MWPGHFPKATSDLRSRSKVPLRLEVLESRLVLSTFTVTVFDGSGVGSLYWAIQSANDSAGDDVIDFSKAGTIKASGNLPAITDSVVIGSAAKKVTVDGKGIFRLFSVTGANISILFTNMVVTNAFSSAGGGALTVNTSGTGQV